MKFYTIIISALVPWKTGKFYKIVLAIGFLVLTTVAKAQFTTLTNETLVNTTTVGDQWDYWWSIRTIAVQPDGGYIIVWIDVNGLDGQAQGIFGQRFNASGAKIGGQFQVNTTYNGDQFSPSVAVAPDGHFLVAWEGPGTSIDVWGQLFTQNGVKIGTEFILSTTVSGSQRYPEVQFYPDGTFVAGHVSAGQTVLQRFDSEGKNLGLETRISSGTGDVIMDGLCVRPDNTLLMTWTSGQDVYAQIFDTNLQPIGTQTRLNAYLTGNQQYCNARVDAAGTIIAVWESHGQDGSGIGIYGRRFDKNLVPLGGEFVITTNTIGNQFEPQIAVAPNGRFFIVWSDNNDRDGGGGTGESVWMREYDANGNALSVEAMVNQSVTGYQAYPVIDLNASGRLVIVWEGNGTQPSNIDSYGVFARAYQLSQAGNTTMSVTPTSTTATDLVAVTMTLTAPSSTTGVYPNPISVSGTNDVFATLVSGPTPISATVGTTPVTFTWIYKITAKDKSGTLTFGGNAYNNTGIIFPYSTSNTITVKPALHLSDLTAPNLVNDSNNPDSAPKVFTIGSKVSNPSLNEITNVSIYLGNGTTPGTFPTTTMTLSQTNNTYQGSFALTPLGGINDCTRSLTNLKPAQPVINGGIDFNRDGLVNASDNGVLSNGKIVVGGRIDVDLNGIANNTDDLPRPPGVFYGWREPPIIDGYIDINSDGLIDLSDVGTYGGEIRNIYWQVKYDVKDAFGQSTSGTCGDFIDDLRYDWVVWVSGNELGELREDVVNKSAKVRCELSAASNKLTPTPSGYISGGPPRVIGGLVDINGNGSITTTDDGFYYDKAVIDGKVDINNSGTITAADNGVVNNFPVIAGYIDVNNSGTITAADDGILVQIGQTFSIIVNNATFGTIGYGYDENRDGLWDIDFWFQPIGNADWPSSSFRLIDIQADLTGSGGSNPLNGIITHYDNEPYLSRLFDDRLNQSGSFSGTYTYTFMATAAGNSFVTPYQEAASGTNNEKYNGDFGIGVNIITGLPCPSVSISPSATTICTGGTATLTATVSTGGDTTSYQWQQLISGIWTNVGTNSASYTTPILAASTDFRIIITKTSIGCELPMATTTITVIADPSVSLSTSASTICTGGTATFTATVSNGSGTSSYQWQRLISGVWTNIGTNAASYTTPALTANSDFRVIVTQSTSGCDVTSAPNTITVVADPSVSITTTAPVICVGGTITLNATLTGGTGTCSFQWQSSTNGTVWTDISGATSNPYTTTILSTNTMYRAQVTCTGNGCCD
jgi:hypothetical protein